jgi:hypothetical protein
MGRTQDVSLFDEGGNYSVIISSDGDLYSKSKLWDGTNQVGVVAGTPNRLAVDTNISGITITQGRVPILESEVTAIENEYGFYASGPITTLTAGSTYTILMITGGNTMYAHLRDMTANVLKSSASGYLYASFWEGATTSANGSAVTSRNNVRYSSVTPTMSLYTQPTITTTGVKLFDYMLHSDWETYMQPSYTSKFTQVLKPNEKYLLQLINNTNQGCTFTWEIFWYEEAD